MDPIFPQAESALYRGAMNKKGLFYPQGTKTNRAAAAEIFEGLETTARGQEVEKQKKRWCFPTPHPPPDM